MTKGKHLDRKSLIEALGHSEAELPEHLRYCRECRELWELLKKYQVAGVSPLVDPPAGWTEMAAEIPAVSKVTPGISRLLARLVFDSWATPQPVGIRGRGTESERRVRYEARGMTFDMRCEKLGTVWSFIAQIRDIPGPSRTVVLRVGRKNLAADSSGLYHWSAGRPPQDIIIEVDDFRIQIPRLSWKKPRSK